MPTPTPEEIKFATEFCKEITNTLAPMVAGLTHALQITHPGMRLESIQMCVGRVMLDGAASLIGKGLDINKDQRKKFSEALQTLAIQTYETSGCDPRHRDYFEKLLKNHLGDPNNPAEVNTTPSSESDDEPHVAIIDYQHLMQMLDQMASMLGDPSPSHELIPKEKIARITAEAVENLLPHLHEQYKSMVKKTGGKMYVGEATPMLHVGLMNVTAGHICAALNQSINDAKVLSGRLKTILGLWIKEAVEAHNSNLKEDDK